jgi:NAD(P)-dependent dehydrogenase (short-subunit alcohol dehydrogenase family)
MNKENERLKGKVAVVTGASRGAGRGIALVLGENGATVYVTGRSVRGSSTRPKLAGKTINETAERVTKRGGKGIPVQCNHTVDTEVEVLFERVKEEEGRIDILVNNVWGGYENYDGTFDVPFWEQPLWRWNKMFTAGVRAHFTASRFAAPLMIPQRRGLIVNTTFWDRGKCLSNLPYDLAKTTINRMAYVTALELREYNITAVALSPGWMRTEAVMNNEPPNKAPTPEELRKTESVEYIGRAVAALSTDPCVMIKTGKTLTVGELAYEYGFTDIDGRYIPPFTMTGIRD